MVQFASISASHEIFARDTNSCGEKGFNRFVLEVEGAAQAAVLDPELALRGYLAWFLDGQHSRRIVLDIKYHQLGRLGLDQKTPALPIIAMLLARWRVPVVHLMRTNALQEAISVLVAEQTGEYMLQRSDPTIGQPRKGVHLDPAAVAEVALARREEHRVAVSMLRALGAPHQRLLTEALRGPQRASEILRILHGFGIWCEPPARLEEPVLNQNSVGRVTNLGQIIEHLRQHSPELVAF